MKKNETDVKPLGHDSNDEEASSSEEAEEVEESEEAGTEESETEETDVEPDESEEDSTDDIDYKAEFERVTKNLDKTGKKVDKERVKRIDAEKKEGLSEDQVTEIVKRENAKSEKRILRSRAEQSADALAGSDAERELILYHYDNSIVLSGNFEEDMENAYACANKKRNKTRISELKAAARSKKTRVSASSAGAPAKNKKTVKYSTDDIDGAEFAGVPVEEFVKKKAEEK